MHKIISQFFSDKFKNQQDFSLDINEEVLFEYDLKINSSLNKKIRNELTHLGLSYEDAFSLLAKKIIYSYDPVNYYNNSFLINTAAIYERFNFVLDSYEFTKEDKLAILSPYGFDERALTNMNMTLELLTLSNVRSFSEQFNLDPSWILNGGNQLFQINRIENNYTGHSSNDKSLFLIQTFFDYLLKGKKPEVYVISMDAPINLMRDSNQSERSSLRIFIRVIEEINGISYFFYEEIATLQPKVIETDRDHLLFIAKAFEVIKVHLDLNLHYFNANDCFPLESNKVMIFNRYINQIEQANDRPEVSLNEYIRPGNPYVEHDDLAYIDTVFQQYDVAKLIEEILAKNGQSYTYIDIQNHFANIILDRNPWK